MQESATKDVGNVPTHARELSGTGYDSEGERVSVRYVRTSEAIYAAQSLCNTSRAVCSHGCVVALQVMCGRGLGIKM